MLTRHEQWEAKLHHSIETHKAKPFAWGEHDCTLRCPITSGRCPESISPPRFPVATGVKTSRWPP